jgi:uncharacterized protein
MSDAAEERLARLQGGLRSLGKAAVAFSGGVDSTLLLAVAHDVLGDGVVALTATPAWVSRQEAEEARAFCSARGIAQVELSVGIADVPGFVDNPPERCYLCKRTLFSAFLAAAHDRGIDTVADGSNVDDLGDFRPGLKALEELGIASPLRAAGLTKADVRELSRELGLPTADKPSAACLASRIPYGQAIDASTLARVDAAEGLLRRLGFAQVRVRAHGKVARIEVEPARIGRLMEPEVRRRVSRDLRELGFSYVTADLEGFRSGSMNEVLGDAPQAR